MRQIEKDIRFIGTLLPQHYEVNEDSRKGSFRCKSTIGISEQSWERFTEKCRTFFGKRLMEFYHTTNSQHKDFTVYLKSVAEKAEQ